MLNKFGRRGVAVVAVLSGSVVSVEAVAVSMRVGESGW